jgi:hypothetical protein
LFIRWLASVNQAALAEATSSFPAPLDLRLPGQVPPVGAPARRVEPASHAHAEPDLASWSSVRWTLGDSASQLFKWYFTMKQLATPACSTALRGLHRIQP